MKLKTLLLLPSLFILSSCSTEWMGSNTTKVVLSEIGTIVFKAAIQSFTTDSKTDLGHSMAKGIWEQGSVAVSSGSIKRIADAWSSDRLPKLATAASTSYAIANPKTVKQQAQVADVIATAISLAAQVSK